LQIDPTRDAFVLDEKSMTISKLGSAGACRLTCHKTTGGHQLAMLPIAIRLQLEGDKAVTNTSRKAEMQEIEKVSVQPCPAVCMTF
jgi:hypothetical protein